MGSFKDSYTKEEEKKRLKMSGNPYASLSMLDDDVGLDDISEKHRQHLGIFQNPYVFLSKFCGVDEQVSVNVAQENGEPSRPVRLRIPKLAFRSECRSIFLQYIPLENGRNLRKEHRDFITRNESRSPEERYMLLEELKKYDLSSTGSYQAHFNREDDVLTKKKLMDVERKVLGGHR